MNKQLNRIKHLVSYDSMFVKKRGQKYIMMWNGPFALRRIEKDTCEHLYNWMLKINEAL